MSIALGAFAAFLLARAMSSLLFGVQPLDLPTFASVIALVLVVAALACALPARWATRVDPTSALRAD
jgi:putative ABC transport system permease protein